MLVMGAYTHSRVRQMLLGGVTRHVLRHAEMPVLMMH
jgi:nucleotide-binding universal stress UspA family protein